MNQPAYKPCSFSLTDGSRVQISQIGLTDQQDWLDGFELLSRESRYFRFFSSMPVMPDHIRVSLLTTDVNRMALGARLLDSNDQIANQRIIGVARYFRAEDELDAAEPAVAVVDQLHRLGLGHLLVRELGKFAFQHGVTRFVARALPENGKVRQMIVGSGGVLVRREEDSLVYAIDLLNGSERYRYRPPRKPH